MSSYEDGYHRGACECCGAGRATRSYGEADRSGHLWHHSVCEQCSEHCSSDEDGNPVHVREGEAGQ